MSAKNVNIFYEGSLREHPLMMSDFRGEGSEMTPKNRKLEGKNRMLEGDMGSKRLKIVRHHLWMIPYAKQ